MLNIAVQTAVRCCVGGTEEWQVEVGSAFSSVFAVVMDTQPLNHIAFNSALFHAHIPFYSLTKSGFRLENDSFKKW